MKAYYNEIDPYCCQWLRNLIDAGHIAPGDVDDRSIEDVTPGDVRGYTQCHYFAGIGVWSYALRLAGWPDDRPAWTGSCPCQPFSQAGKGAGFADERHLWPAWFHLIRECRPERIFGEQVASSLGLEWLTGIQADLEAESFAVGAVDLCAASVAAPHRRQRIYWLADADRQRFSRRTKPDRVPQEPTQPPSRWDHVGGSRFVCAIDGRERRIGAGVAPLVDGYPGRVGELRATGNAIVPQVAAQFIRAYLG